MNELCGGIISAGVPGPGPYLSTVKPLFMLLLVMPWLYAATWMNKDTLRVQSVRTLWCGAVLAAGVLGILLWLLVPLFVVGMLLYLVLAGGVVGAYVAHRNKRVVPEAKVLTADHIRSVWARKDREKVEVVQHLKLYDHNGRPVLPPEEKLAEQRKAYNAAQELLHDVVLMRASEVDLKPKGPQVQVRFVVDGVLQERPSMDRGEADRLVDFLKGLAGLDVEDKRRPQAGAVSADMGVVRADMKLTTAGTTHGQRVQMRVLQEAIRTKLEELGMPDGMLARLAEINADDGGLILVSGPRGNGVTSTLYSLMRKHDAYMKQLVTLEESVAVELENITQQAYPSQKELPAKLASLLRRDPDVVMVDRCETAETAELLADAASAKNVLLGCVADGAFMALARWVKVCADPAKALGPLRAVTCQKLLRKICPSCREAYKPPKEMLAKLNLPVEKIKSFYRPPTKPLTDEKGKPMTCPTCRGTGYFGRTASFEMLEISDEIRQRILGNAPLSQIKAAARRNGMLYLQEQALRKVIEGTTSVDEVIRVSRSKQ